MGILMEKGEDMVVDVWRFVRVVDVVDGGRVFWRFKQSVDGVVELSEGRMIEREVGG